jgi:hypothetical protein
MMKGVSPLISVVLLLSIVVARSGSAYVFLSGQQQRVEEGVEQAQLETVNISCNRQTVSWWIQNTAQYGVEQRQADIFFMENGQSNQSLYRPNELLPSSLTAGETIAEIFLTLSPDALKLGEEYRLELVTDETDVTSTCRVGAQWWDVNWDYRRHVAMDGSTVDADDRTSIKINPQQLVREGKLQPHCQDLRIVIGTTPVSYNLSTSPENCVSATDLDVTFQVNNVATDRYHTYLYYGNPAADNQSVSIASSAPQSAFGDEEHISRPQ